MTSGIRLTAAGFGLPRSLQRIYRQEQAGFDSANMLNLYLIEDDDPTAKIADALGNGDTALVLAAGTAATLLTGGGVSFQKNSYIAGTAFDIRGAWTIMGAYTVPHTTTTVNNLLEMGFSEYPTYGLAVTGSEAGVTAAGATRIPFLTPSVNGAAGSAQALQAPRPTYDSPAQSFLSHDGAGNFTLSVFERGALCNNLTMAYDVAKMIAGTGVAQYLLHPCIGLAYNPASNKTALSVDIMGTWLRQLSAEQRAAAAANAWSKQQSRGRV